MTVTQKCISANRFKQSLRTMLDGWRPECFWLVFMKLSYKSILLLIEAFTFRSPFLANMIWWILISANCYSKIMLNKVPNFEFIFLLLMKKSMTTFLYSFMKKTYFSSIISQTMKQRIKSGPCFGQSILLSGKSLPSFLPFFLSSIFPFIYLFF